MDTQEKTNGAAGEEPAVPSPDQGDSTDEEPSPEAKVPAVQDLEERVQRLTSNWQRSQADLANYRKQVEREQLELVQLTTQGLTADTISILDDFERAFTTIPMNLRSLTWIEGVWLVYKKLESILHARGLEAVEAEPAQVFDPNLHQALSEVDGDAGTIIEVAQKGYTMGGRLLRPALVTVGKGKPVTEETPDINDDTETTPDAESTPDT